MCGTDAGVVGLRYNFPVATCTQKHVCLILPTGAGCLQEVNVSTNDLHGHGAYLAVSPCLGEESFLMVAYIQRGGLFFPACAGFTTL